ncbi:hypothetical protein M426DRAFT_319015 [Hypoxylon sp. CI-4A]|nr:hypothetical protein M426DRAFT_319015 [Hypoxylon sp. CI-4A]
MPEPDTLSLAGKVAIVTGSGRETGIGAATARALAKNGASVTIHYLSEGSAPRAAKLAQSIRDEYGVGVALVQADVSKPEDARKIVSETLKQLNVDHVDILVNNAGVGPVQPLLTSTPKDIEYVFGTNVNGTIYVTQAATDLELGKMPKGGRIINIGSVASKLGPSSLPLYAASKAAQDLLTVTLAAELGRTRGITVNTLGPGPITTDMNKDYPEVVDAMVALQRGADFAGGPEEIANAVLLLTSEKARWITAQYIAVDAGVVGNA